MRDKRFIAHRSGSLNKEHHIQLIKWACDYAEIAVARAIGHTVATAHMADHSLGAALYALKAVKIYNQKRCRITVNHGKINNCPQKLWKLF